MTFTLVGAVFMKVLYNIEELGASRYHIGRRTGVFRVVENVALGLVASPECDLSFYASHSFQSCQNYLKNQPRFKDVPLVNERSLRAQLQSYIYKEPIGAQVAPLISPADLKLLYQRRELLQLTRELQLRKRVARKIGFLFSKRFPPIDAKTINQADIYHTASIEPIPDQAHKARKTKKFLTVHDLIPILHPQFCRPNQAPHLDAVLNSLSSEDWAITVSQTAKDDLCNYRGVDPSRVFVTPLAATPEYFYPCLDATRIASTCRAYNIPDEPYFLSLCTLEPRKNVSHIIQCFAEMVQQQKVNPLNLVLVGGKGLKAEEIISSVCRHETIKRRVIVTGYVADADLAALYSGAMAFFFLSFCEGFGLPPLEAMQCGVPVITSNVTSLPEVVGDAGIMLDPTDKDGLRQIMLKVFNSSTLRKSLSSRSLERAKEFSWDKCVRETIAAYKATLDA